MFHMIVRKIFSLLTLVLSCAAMGQTITPEIEKRAVELVAQMTLEEKLAYIGGYNGFFIRPIPRLGIPEIRMADGPQGVRNDTHSTMYPCGIAAAATWNRELARTYGHSLGQDARARGVHIMLGPGVNIYRSPLCGRNYEYYGEDPFLTSETAVAYIEGMQAAGVMATIKHFCGNNQEWNRHNVSSDIDERTLHEIYLPAFRKAVQKARVGAVMSSYNPVNSIHTTESRELIIGVLREKWNFKGIYMSDWTATYSTVGAANNGLDLEMSWGQFMNPDKLRVALATGTVTEETIDEKCRHIVQTLIAFGFFDREQRDWSIPEKNPVSSETALAVAREAVVLLKNDGDMLPFSRKIRNVVVMGPNATNIPTGGGSGFVMPFETVSVAEGIRNADKRIRMKVLAPELSVDLTARGCFFTPDGKPGLRGEFFANPKLEGNAAGTVDATAIDFFWQNAPVEGVPATQFSARWTGTFIPSVTGQAVFQISGDDGYRLYIDDREIIADWYDHFITMKRASVDVEAGKSYKVRLEYYNAWASGTLRMCSACHSPILPQQEIESADAVIYCAGFDSSTEGENCDRSFSLPQQQLKEIAEAAMLNPNLIVVVNAGGGVDFTPIVDKARAVLMAWYPGQEGGRAIAEILTGRINPSGRLPITVERRAEDNPTFDSYRANVAQVYNSPLRVSYDEGVFVGYRGYDRTDTEPMYPFGYGLSYTTFDYANLKMERLDDGNVAVSFEVTNTGRFAGSEVAQLYVGDEVASVPRPEKELKGYEKVRLEPGETKSVEIRLSPDAFAFYDMNRHDFVIEPGDFTISVGASSRDIRLSEKIRID